MCDVDLNVSTSIDGFTIFAQCRSDDPRLKCITANMDKCGQRNVFTIMAANTISPTLQNCDCMVIKVTVSDLLKMHNFAQILLAIIVILDVPFSLIEMTIWLWSTFSTLVA